MKGSGHLPVFAQGFQSIQFVFTAAQPDLLSMLQGDFPIDLRVHAAEFIPSRGMAAGQGRVRQALCLVDQVGTGLIEGHRVAAGEDADVRDDGGVRVPVAVAGRTDLGNEVEVELFAGFAAGGTQRVLSHLAHHLARLFVPLDLDRFFVADGDTAAAAGTFVR